MSERANKDDLGTQMMETIRQHADNAKVEFLASASVEISRIYSSSDDPQIKQICREIRGKMLDLSNKITTNILQEAGF